MRSRRQRDAKEQREDAERNEVCDPAALGRYDPFGCSEQQISRNFHSAAFIGQQYTLSHLRKQCAGRLPLADSSCGGILSDIETRLSLTLRPGASFRQSIFRELSSIAIGKPAQDAFPIGSEHEDSFFRELNWYMGILGRMRSAISCTDFSEATAGEASVLRFGILARPSERSCTQKT
jgi:hypothetical protein